MEAKEGIKVGIAQPETVEDIVVALKAYNSVNQNIKELEAEKKRLRTIIEPMVKHEGGRLEVAKYVATLSDVSRESFNLKAALEKLDKRVLKPFIKKTSYPRLTVKIGE